MQIKPPPRRRMNADLHPRIFYFNILFAFLTYIIYLLDAKNPIVLLVSVVYIILSLIAWRFTDWTK